MGESSLDVPTDSLTNVVDVGHKHGARRYYESVLSPGDEVFVRGYGRRSDGGTVVVEPGANDDGPLFLSTRSRDAVEPGSDLTGLYLRAAAVSAAVGVAIVGVGLYVLSGG